MFKTETRIWLEHVPTLIEFLGDNWTIPILYVLFYLNSILIIHLNHSNRIRNEQVMVKIRRLVKTEQGVPVHV